MKDDERCLKSTTIVEVKIHRFEKHYQTIPNLPDSKPTQNKNCLVHLVAICCHTPHRAGPQEPLRNIFYIICIFYYIVSTCIYMYLHVSTIYYITLYYKLIQTTCIIMYLHVPTLFRQGEASSAGDEQVLHGGLETHGNSIPGWMKRQAKSSIPTCKHDQLPSCGCTIFFPHGHEHHCCISGSPG